MQKVNSCERIVTIFFILCNVDNFSLKARMSAECFRRIIEGKFRTCSSKKDMKGYSHLLVTNGVHSPSRFWKKVSVVLFFLQKEVTVVLLGQKYVYGDFRYDIVKVQWSLHSVIVLSHKKYLVAQKTYIVSVFMFSYF